MDAAVALLATLLAGGVEIVADGELVRFRPGHSVTPGLRDGIARHKPELIKLLTDPDAQVAWRSERMRGQVPPAGPVPFLVAQDSTGDVSARCRSCGDRLPPDARVRCRPCLLAATEVLRELRPGAPDRLLRGDCRDLLPTLPADSVQLIVTSPPYNVGWEYGDDGAGDRRPHDEYLALLAETIAGCQRVLRPGGVLALNLPPTVRRPDCRAWPLASWASMYLTDHGWLVREPLVWVKSSKAGQPLAMGTAIGGPANPSLRPCHELVLLASKGESRMGNKGGWPPEDRYIEWLKDVWHLPAARARRGNPPAFPDELVRRLVLLFSAPGDVVLDPFAGTGTVGRVARAQGRTAWLVEREPSYWPRILAALGQGDMSEAS